MENKILCDTLVEFGKAGKYLIAICAAPMILGELGLLRGKMATCYPSFEKYLHEAVCTDDDVCVAKNILTSRGAGTAHELAFRFVEICKGKECALNLKDAMQYR